MEHFWSAMGGVLVGVAGTAIALLWVASRSFRGGF
jgi:hypothetical protein